MTLLKQFETLAIGSNLSNHFKSLRLKLFLLTTAVLVGLFVITSFSVVQFSRVRFEQRPLPELRTSNSGQGTLRDDLRDDLRNFNALVRQQNIDDLTETVIWTNSVVVVMLLVVLWLGLGLILRPISKVYSDKEDFLKHASHDLRTPLAILKSDLQLAQNSKTTEQYSQAIEDGLVQVNSLHALAAGYLDQMSGEPETVPTYRKEMVNVRELIQKIWNERENQNSLNLSLELPKNHIKINANQILLEQVLKNAIDNAMKYSVPNTVVKVIGNTEEITIQNQTDIIEIKTGVGLGIIEKNMGLLGGKSFIHIENGECALVLRFD
jgi:signal transduction histidine kinase